MPHHFLLLKIERKAKALDRNYNKGKKKEGTRSSFTEISGFIMAFIIVIQAYHGKFHSANQKLLLKI